MSELVAKSDELSGFESATSQAAWTDLTDPQIASADLVAGKKYLVMVRGETHSWTLNAVGAVRLVHGSTAFTGSERRWQTVWNTNDREVWNYMTVWTAVAGEALKVQAQGDGLGADAGHRWASLIAIKLSDDLTEGTDWLSDEDNGALTLTGSLQTGATKTWTPANNGNLWLVLSHATLEHDTATDEYVSRLDHTGGATEGWDQVIAGRRAGDIYQCPGVWVGTLSNASQTFREQAKRVGSGAATARRLHSFVFALNLSRFAGVTHFEDDADFTLVTTSPNQWPNNIKTQDFTPPVNNGAMLVLTYCLNDPQDATVAQRYYLHRTQVDGLDLYSADGVVNTYSTIGSNAPRLMFPRSGDAAQTYAYIDFHVRRWSDQQHTYTWDGAVANLTGAHAVKNRRVLLLSLEATAPPVASSGGSTYERSDLIMYVNDYSAGRRRIPVRCVQTDHVTALTTAAGAQGSVSKNGGALTTTGVGVLVAVDQNKGLYYAELTAGALDTIGSLVFQVQPTGGDLRSVTVQVEELPYLWDGSATSPFNSNTISFASPPSFVPKGSIVRIINGTGAGQSQIVTAYASPQATLETNWETTPDASSKVVILPGLPNVVPDVNVAKVNASATAAAKLQAGADAMLSGTIQSGTNTTTVVTTNLPVTVGGVTTPTDFYKGRAIYFTAPGKLAGDVAVITGSSVVSGQTQLDVDTLSQVPAVNDPFVIT